MSSDLSTVLFRGWPTRQTLELVHDGLAVASRAVYARAAGRLVFLLPALWERLLTTESLYSSQGTAMEAARERAHPAGDRR